MSEQQSPKQDPRNWKSGVFYFNKSDKRLMVSKRSGLGWTFNFASPWAWLILISLLVFLWLLTRA